MRYIVGRLRYLAAATALFGALVPMNAALASAGCDAVNGGGFNFSVAASDSATRPAQTFAAGDVLSFTITRVNSPGSDGVNFTLSDSVTSDPLVSRGGMATSETGSYTVTAAALSIQASLESLGSSASVTVTCTPVVTGPTDSQKLRSMQIQGTKIVAQTSGGAIAGAVGSAIGQSIGSGAGTGTPPSTGGPAGLGGPKPYGLGRTARGENAGAPSGTAVFALERQGWSAWGDLRFIDSRRKPDAGGFEGQQVNGTAGIGRVVAPGLVVGAFGGIERFAYDVAALAGGLSGHGVTGGAYLGWRLTPGVVFDLAGAYSALDYEATAGAATGNFEGRRK
ncbi:MAG: autotransporter domain-containing protein, partial [Hyphomicrobium sp.]